MEQKELDELVSETLGEYIVSIRQLYGLTDDQAEQYKKDLQKYLVELTDSDCLDIDDDMKIISMPANMVEDGIYKYLLYYNWTRLLESPFQDQELLKKNFWLRKIEEDLGSEMFEEYLRRINAELVAIFLNYVLNDSSQELTRFIVDGKIHSTSFYINCFLGELAFAVIDAFYNRGNESDNSCTDCLYQFVQDCYNGTVITKIYSQVRNINEQYFLERIMFGCTILFIHVLTEQIDESFNGITMLLIEAIEEYKNCVKDSIVNLVA